MRGKLVNGISCLLPQESCVLALGMAPSTTQLCHSMAVHGVHQTSERKLIGNSLARTPIRFVVRDS
eukprot:6284915-Amphidinium_carterae.1